MPNTYLFVALQIMDFLTTLIGIKLGARETNPMIRFVMQFGPAEGLVICKAAGFILGGIFIWTGRQRVIDALNFIFSGIVVWNLCNLLLIPIH